MDMDLVRMVTAEEQVARTKWGSHDQIPDNLISAAVEELGEVAHAINHEEGLARTNQEIVHSIGVLSRLYNMVNGIGG